MMDWFEYELAEGIAQDIGPDYISAARDVQSTQKEYEELVHRVLRHLKKDTPAPVGVVFEAVQTMAIVFSARERKLLALHRKVVTDLATHIENLQSRMESLESRLDRPE